MQVRLFNFQFFSFSLEAGFIQFAPLLKSNGITSKSDILFPQKYSFCGRGGRGDSKESWNKLNICPPILRIVRLFWTTRGRNLGHLSDFNSRRFHPGVPDLARRRIHKLCQDLPGGGIHRHILNKSRGRIHEKLSVQQRDIHYPVSKMSAILAAVDTENFKCHFFF